MKKSICNPVKTILGVALPCAALFVTVHTMNAGVAAEPVAPAAPGLRALIVGGGPSPDYNQVSISKNVRYVRRLLPAGTPHITLFATGNPNDATVLEGSSEMSESQSMLQLILEGTDASFSTPHYAKPNLGGRLDGASSPAQLQRAFARLNKDNQTKALPLLLYFTGHGGPGWNRGTANYENNTYGLWNDEDLTVRELAKYIGALPPQVPVTLVMVQCYSGGFGNVLFNAGEANGALIPRDIVGFFATVKDHTAAGCTSEVNEKEYRDFTSYFFAALCGQDRVGRRVTGADYNADGRVGMDEAYYYSIGHDVSIDIPTATSDVFLRRFVPADERTILQTTYSQLLSWANPAQKAALGELSTRLKLTGEDRLLTAYRELTGESWASQTLRRFTGNKTTKMEDFHATESASASLTTAYRKFSVVWKAERSGFLRRYPALASPRSAGYARTRTQALAQLAREVKTNRWEKLSAAYSGLSDAYAGMEKAETEQSLHLRFLRLCKTLVLTHQLQNGSNVALKQRFTRLLASESRTLLPFIKMTTDQVTLSAQLPGVQLPGVQLPGVQLPAENERPEARDACGCGVPSASTAKRVAMEW